jgi:hypothetical protein
LIAAADHGGWCAAAFSRPQAVRGYRVRAFPRQRGWIGLIGLLLALVIVALLAQRLLKTYGLLPVAEPGAKSERGLRGPGSAGPAPMDATTVTPTPGAAIERARGLESQVQQQGRENEKRIDDETK